MSTLDGKKLVDGMTALTMLLVSNTYRLDIDDLKAMRQAMEHARDALLTELENREVIDSWSLTS